MDPDSKRLRVSVSDGTGRAVRDGGDGRSEASLLLEGIHCGACIWLLETWLARTPGVVLVGGCDKTILRPIAT